MENAELFKWLAIFSPVVTGVTVGFLTHKLSNRSKRKEIQYQNKLRAFNELSKILIDYKLELASIIYNNPFLERSSEAKGSVETLSLLNNASIRNRIYLNNKSREAVMDLTTKINFFCTFKTEEFKNINPYLEMAVEVEKVIIVLDKNLNPI